MRLVFGTNKSAQAERGFTLLEVLVSVVLLSIAILAVAGLQVIGMRGTVTGEERGVAAALALARLHELSSMTYTRSAATDALVDNLLPGGGFGNAALCTDRVINRYGLTAEELALAASGAPNVIAQEIYPFTVHSCVLDTDAPSEHKLLSVTVTWADRLTNLAGATNRLEILNFPLLPKVN